MGRRISALPDGDATQATDLVPIERAGGTNYKLSGEQLAQFVLGKIVDDEVPEGPIDGANAVFTLAHAPSPVASLNLFLNGMRLRRGTDYTLTAAEITYAVAPAIGDNHYAFYRH